ncbi:MAG TPA: insulinase family protein [Puia sp.]|nr:insulinase family protein [Puia sp.]
MARSRAQPQLTEVGNMMTGKYPGIPFKKFRLPNGLTILLLEDHSIPRVVVNVVYKVGSAQDPEGRSGMAHFFEHLMFKGSRHVPDGDHNRLLAESGGTANAQTFPDRTIFKNTAPGNALQRVLWLEADRMGGWLNSFDRPAFEAQRKVILNERMRNTENSASEQVDEFTSMIYYPVGHPYRRPVVGFADDIRSITFDDAVAFYRKYYLPSNAILCVGGNFRTDQALAWVSEYFGPIPGASRRALTESVKFPLRRFTSVLTIDDPLVNNPIITIQFPTVKRYDPDFAALECIGHLLGGSANAFLNTTLQKQIPGCSVFAFNYGLQNGGDFSIIANLPAGASPQAAKDSIFHTIQAFGEQPEEELEKKVDQFRKWVAFRKLFETENVEGKIFNLILYETILGRANFFPDEMEAYDRLTAAKVKSAFHHYILNGPCMIAMANHSANRSDLKDFYARREVLRAETANAPLATGLDASSKALPHAASRGSFDSTIYPPLDTTRFSFQGRNQHWSRNLSNGIALIGEVDNTTPVMSIDVYCRNTAFPPTDLTGLAYIIQNCPSKHYTADELAQMIDECGAYHYCKVDDNSIIIQIKCLPKYIDSALVWMREKLLYAVVTDSLYDAAWSRVHRDELAATTDINTLATEAFTSLGPDPTSGLPDTSIGHLTERLSKETAKAILGSPDPRTLEVICYGPISPGELAPKFSFLSDLGNDASVRPIAAHLKTSAPPGIYCFDVPDAKQIAIRCGFDLPATCSDTDLYKLSFANYIFGGFFNSRLNSELREKKGYTYRAYSYLINRPGYTSFFVDIIISPSDLPKALPEIMHQVDSFSENGLSPRETWFLKTAFTFSNPLLSVFYYDKMKFLMQVGSGELREDIDQIQHAMIDSLSTDELNEVVRRLVDPSKFRIVLVGDGKSISAGLNELMRQTTDKKVRLDKYEFPVFIRL